MTPLLIEYLIIGRGFITATSAGTATSSAVVNVDGVAVLLSVLTLVLGPLLLGLGFGHFVVDNKKLLNGSRITNKTRVMKIRNLLRNKICPLVGIGATLLLVAGGAANAAVGVIASADGSLGVRSIMASILLPLFGCVTAIGFVNLANTLARPSSKSKSTMIIDEKSKRTLVVEILSKSPTLAYVLAQKHFMVGSSNVPAAAMVSLAVVGALVASVWSYIPSTSITQN